MNKIEQEGERISGNAREKQVLVSLFWFLLTHLINLYYKPVTECWSVCGSKSYLFSFLENFCSVVIACG
jgi:hypothetical protein